MWDDFELKESDLDKDAVEQLKAEVLSTYYRETLRPIFNGYFRDFSARNVLESCAIISKMPSTALGIRKAAQLLKKDARDKLLAIAKNKEHGIPAVYIDEFIDMIAMRFFMQQENNRLQDIAKSLLNDLKLFAESENKDLTEVFNRDITNNFIDAVNDCVEQKRVGTFFDGTDFSFYQASNLVKVEEDLPARPDPPQWASDFLRAHPLLEGWWHASNYLEIERNFLWRMEVQMKIVEPIVEFRNRTFVPLLFLNQGVTEAPFFKSALFEPKLIEEMKKLLGSPPGRP
jgi:hypothetical protein